MAEIAHHFEDSGAYERFMGQWSRAVGTVFLEWLAAPAGAAWLDVGCGTGIFTELVLGMCSPRAVAALDPAPAQIAHARGRPAARGIDFRTGDAQALPFADAAFDVVTAALVLNFIPDRPRALAEMRRVARPRGIVAGYVWDFSQERSPSWPLRRGMRECGIEVPDVPGTAQSTVGALGGLFRHATLQAIATMPIEVTRSYTDFDDFWDAQTPSYSPTTRMIAAMPAAARQHLRDAVQAGLPVSADGRIAYSARAIAIKGYVAA